MRNVTLEAKLIRRQIRYENRINMLYGSIHAASQIGDPHLQRDKPFPLKGWVTVICLAVVLGVMAATVL